LKIGDDWKIVGKVFWDRTEGKPLRSEADAKAEESRIRALIEHKMASMDENNGALLQSCYLPQATTASLLEGDIVIYPIQEWIARFDVYAAANRRESGVSRTIERIEVAGDAAYVRFSHRFPNFYVIDRALLVRHGGHWRIAHLDYLVTNPPKTP
jgi:hypothetical protein